jgi:DNA (cytosine-5)-methyltransferase 1
LSANNTINFIDFCAGIGGGRLGLTSNGLKCAAYSEIDECAEKTYKLLFDTENEKKFGDLMKINPEELPDFDIMLGGFPCQTFSIVGKREGLEDQRGQIIYGLINILKENNIKYFILENVKGLLSHNGGQTIKSIMTELSNAGYVVYNQILDSRFYGVPQMRERIYFVGFRKDLVSNKIWFNFPNEKPTPNLKDYLIDTDNNILPETDSTFQRYLNNKYNKDKFDLNKILAEDYLVLDTRQSDLRLYREVVPTLRTGRHGILYVKDKKLKKLSGYEALLLQGFPKEYALKAKGKIPDTKLLSQAGNAMTVSVISDIAKRLLEYIKE